MTATPRPRHQGGAPLAVVGYQRGKRVHAKRTHAGFDAVALNDNACQWAEAAPAHRGPQPTAPVLALLRVCWGQVCVEKDKREANLPVVYCRGIAAHVRRCLLP